MRPSFYGLEISRTGLFISQKQLDVTGHNISNAETEGYSRQRLDTANIAPLAYTTFWLDAERGRVGGGVESLTTKRLRDPFLDRQYRDEKGEYEYFKKSFETLDFVQKLYLDQTTDRGLTSNMEAFVRAINQVATAPESLPQRQAMVGSATTLCHTLNNISQQMEKQMLECNDRIEASVTRINSISKSIAALNKEIYGFEMNGENANDLRDKRDLLLDELSGYGDIKYSETTGHFKVEFCGGTLVDHTDGYTLQTTPGAYNNVTNQPDARFLSIEWSDNSLEPGFGLTFNRGSLSADIDMRDGDTADKAGVPYFLNQLNAFAALLASEFNAIHAGGYTYPNAATGESKTGVPFFDSRDGEPISASNIWLSAEILDSPWNIAASDEQIGPDIIGPGDDTTNERRGNGKNALLLAGILDVTAGTNSTVGGVWLGYLADLGIKSSEYKDMMQLHTTMELSVNNLRLSISGVSIDEEMTNLIRFNHAYSASSRMITAFDECLDKLINGTGRVGL